MPTITTKEKIFQLADELDAKGQKPTLAAIRKGLGGGSYTTISEIMTEWKTRRASKERPLMEPAPQAVVDHLTDLGGRIWSLALEQANGRLEVERENLAAVRSQIEAEKVEAAELADHLTAELDSMKNHVAALEKAEKDARNEVECLTGQVTSLSERAAVSEAHQSDLEKHVSDLNDELARVNQQNSELIKALAESIS